MLTFPLVKPVIRFQGQTAPSTKPVLLSVDIDQTLIKWTQFGLRHDEVALARTVKALQSAKDKSVILLNTGRGLDSIRQIAPLLKNVPFDYLALNNGMELYKPPTDKPVEPWLTQLSAKQQGRLWQKDIKAQTGLTTRTIIKAIHDVATREGFVKSQGSSARPGFTQVLPSGETLTIERYPTEAAFAITGTAESLSPQQVLYVQGLAGKIAQALKQQGLDVVCKQGTFKRGIPEGGEKRYTVFRYFPKAISKASVLQHVASQMPGLRAVVTAGDHHDNDTEMLTQVFYKTACGKRVVNYPILSGNDPKLLDDLKQQSKRYPGFNFLQSTQGDIGTQIKGLMDRINIPQSAQKLNRFA